MKKATPKHGRRACSILRKDAWWREIPTISPSPLNIEGGSCRTARNVSHQFVPGWRRRRSRGGDGDIAEYAPTFQDLSRVCADRARRGTDDESVRAKEYRTVSGLGAPGGESRGPVWGADPAIADEDRSKFGPGAPGGESRKPIGGTYPAIADEGRSKFGPGTPGGGTCKGSKEFETKRRKGNQGVQRPYRLTSAKTRVTDEIEELCDRPERCKEWR